MSKSILGFSEILVVAAETSSTLYAERLMQEWQRRGRNIKMFGIGSRSMERLGFECLGRSEELAVVGFSEVVKHWGDIRGAFDRLVDAAKTRKPALALLLDYPDFNLRLAKKLKKLGIPVVYYISPQVWAWRSGRVRLIKKVVDRMLVVFPFEVDFYKKFGVNVDFVGHPLLDEIQPSLFDEKARTILRTRFGLRDDHLVLGLMPGSRNSELHHHFELQIDALRLVLQQRPDIQAAILVAPNFSISEIKQRLSKVKVPIMLVQDEPFRMVSMCDVILCASGTATLMVGLMGKPMVIMYRMSSITAWIAKTFVRNTTFFGLINLVLGRKVVPELFQEQASALKLSEELLGFLNTPQRRRDVSQELLGVHDRLGNKGASVRVIDILESML